MKLMGQKVYILSFLVGITKLSPVKAAPLISECFLLPVTTLGFIKLSFVNLIGEN
jgi:hypothetical protein